MADPLILYSRLPWCAGGRSSLRGCCGALGADRFGRQQRRCRPEGFGRVMGAVPAAMAAPKPPGRSARGGAARAVAALLAAKWGVCGRDNPPSTPRTPLTRPHTPLRWSLDQRPSWDNNGTDAPNGLWRTNPSVARPAKGHKHFKVHDGGSALSSILLLSSPPHHHKWESRCNGGQTTRSDGRCCSPAHCRRHGAPSSPRWARNKLSAVGPLFRSRLSAERERERAHVPWQRLAEGQTA